MLIWIQNFQLCTKFFPVVILHNKGVSPYVFAALIHYSIQVSEYLRNALRVIVELK